MKKLCFLLALFIVSFSFTSCEQENVKTINVYNWGEYISDGSEESFNSNKGFEEYYEKTYGEKIKVNYTTYSDNETMYNKLKSGGVSYDVIVPSDYMIGKLIKENMLLKLDFSNIENFKNINDNFKNLFYDKTNEYSVPYTYGMVGVIYNQTMVDEEIDSWKYIFDEKYKGKILQFNNPRDAFGTAMYYKNYSVNSTDEEVWRDSLKLLKKQKPLVQSYVMDEIFNKMKNGSAAIAPYYAGDFLSMYEDNEDLAFAYPKEGTNIFVDCFCIPSCCENKLEAERYINYMLTKEPAVANAEFIYYASPNKLVAENEGYIEYMNSVHENCMEILYPESTEFKTEYYHTLDEETVKLENDLWEELKIENSVEASVYIFAGAIVSVIILLALYSFIIKKKRAKYY